MHRAFPLSLPFLAFLIVLSPRDARAEQDPVPPLPPPAASPPPTPPAPPTTAAPPPPPPAADVTIVMAPPPKPAPPPAPPCAEPPGAHVHDGFYFRLAEGFGYTSITGEGSSGRTSINGGGAATTLLIGGTPARGFVVGGGLHVTGAEGALEGGALRSSSVSGSALTLGPFVDFYPDPKDGWHVGLLAGLGGASVSQGPIHESTLALGGTLLGGYDAWIGPEWSLGVLGAASAATPGTLSDGNGNDTGYRATPFSFVIEATLLLH